MVLDIGIGQPLARARPTAAFEQIALDVQRRLLVAVNLRVLVHEQAFGIGMAHHRIVQRAHLRSSRNSAGERGGGGNQYRGRQYRGRFHRAVLSLTLPDNARFAPDLLEHRPYSPA